MTSGVIAIAYNHRIIMSFSGLYNDSYDSQSKGHHEEKETTRSMMRRLFGAIVTILVRIISTISSIMPNRIGARRPLDKIPAEGIRFFRIVFCGK